MSRIYTRTGDTGTTSLIGARVDKDDARVQAYGDIDEADSVLGLAKGNCKYDCVIRMINTIQLQLKSVMAEIASVDGGYMLDAKQAVGELESYIDELSNHLPPLTKLITPGGNHGSPWLHLARTVVRRAERNTVALSKVICLNQVVIEYLNRLSDLCFVMARFEDEYSGC